MNQTKEKHMQGNNVSQHSNDWRVLGMGSHLVAVPYDSLKLVNKRLMLPGGTKESLRMVPEFKHASE